MVVASIGMRVIVACQLQPGISLVAGTCEQSRSEEDEGNILSMEKEHVSISVFWRSSS